MTRSTLPTTKTAPSGYVGPIRLTPEQRERTAQLQARWVETLVAQARDDSDPETRDNARLLLTNQGIGWEGGSR